MATSPGRSPTLSILIMIVVGLVVGGGVAAIVEGFGLGGRTVALIAGAVAVLLASLVRYKLVSGLQSSGEERLIGVMVVYGLISTVAGSLAGHDLYSFLDARMPIFLGAIVGVLSACVMAIAMVTFHENRARA